MALKAHQTIEKLKPQVEIQADLEQQLSQLRNKLAAAAAAANQARSVEEKLAGCVRSSQRFMCSFGKRKPGASLRPELLSFKSVIPEWSNSWPTCGRPWNGTRSFRQRSKAVFVPILSQKCLNLKDGETLESFVTSQFSEMRSQIEAFENGAADGRGQSVGVPRSRKDRRPHSQR